MKPRRTSRLAYRRAWANALQRRALQAVARGERAPICEREQLFLWTLQSTGHATYADYIVPWPLLLAESGVGREATQAEDQDEEAPGEPPSSAVFSESLERHGPVGGPDQTVDDPWLG